MPRVIDTSVNEILSRPEYYNEAQREEYIEKQILDEVLEPAIPPLPTRQMELDYLEQLEKEFRQDRWLHRRWRKLQAGPLRRPYKVSKELVDNERHIYLLNFFIGAVLISPLAIFLGRRNRLTSGGIPKVYFPRNYNRFPNVNPDNHGHKYFYSAFFATLTVGGLSTGWLFTKDRMKDDYYSRPDLKPSTPMVEDTDDIKKAKAELLKAEYGYEAQPMFKKTAFYRLFRPNSADYSLHYADRNETDHPGNTYNRNVGGFPSAKRMHEHHWD